MFFQRLFYKPERLQLKASLIHPSDWLRLRWVSVYLEGYDFDYCIADLFVYFFDEVYNHVQPCLILLIRLFWRLTWGKNLGAKVSWGTWTFILCFFHFTLKLCESKIILPQVVKWIFNFSSFQFYYYSFKKCIKGIKSCVSSFCSVTIQPTWEMLQRSSQT